MPWDCRLAHQRVVDCGHGWCQLVQHRLHLTRIGSLQTEIRKHHNHFVMSLVWWHVRDLECRAFPYTSDDFTAVRSQSGNYRWLAPSCEWLKAIGRGERPTEGLPSRRYKPN